MPRHEVDSGEVTPATDVQEYTSFASAIDFSADPVRLITIVDAGSGTLVIRTIASGSTNRTLTALTAGERIEPTQITQIRPSGDGTNVAKIRVYK